MHHAKTQHEAEIIWLLAEGWDLYFEFQKFKMSLLLNVLHTNMVYLMCNINTQVSTTVYMKILKHIQASAQPAHQQYRLPVLVILQLDNSTQFSHSQ